MLALTRYRLKRSLLSFILVLLLSHCAYIPFYQDSLYDRLGGIEAITAVVDDFTNNVVEDDRVNHFFANSDLEEFKYLLVNQICEATGGPCIYKGADMRSSHEGLEIRESDFTAVVEDLIKTLDKFAVPETEKNELLSLLGSMQNDIVEPEQSLYERLGGIDAIKAVVDDLTNNVVEDDRINHFFANSDLDEFKGLLVDQICEATGGPCIYKGADMLSSHEGLEIRESDFTALVEDLIKTLDKFAVPEREKNELLSLLGSMQNDIVESEQSLYERLGGMEAIKAVVDDMTNNVVEDDRINHFFANSDLEEFKGLLVDQICEATGGPCVYKGADMLSSHEGLEIRESDFNALVEDLIKTLDKFSVPETERNELLTLLGSMKNDIVEPEINKSAIKPILPLSTSKQSSSSLKPVPKIIKPSIAQSKTHSAAPSSTLSKKSITAKRNVPVPAKGRVRGKINIKGVANKKKPPNGAIIVLESLDPAFKYKKVRQQSHVVDMKKKVYLPALLSINTNDNIAFHNLDKIKHNVFSVSKGASFDLGTYRAGKRPAIRFKKTGVVKVYCNIHSKMATFIMVTNSPFHQVTQANGGFDFQSVPVGNYKLTVWSIRGNSEQIIEVKENENISLNITLDTSRFILKPHLNKKGLAYPKKPKRIDSADDDEEYF